MAEYPSFPIAATLASSLQAGDVTLLQVRGSATGKLLAELHAHIRRPLLAVVAEPEEMLDLVGDLDLFGAQGVLPFPAWEVLPTETDSPETETAHQRVAVLRSLGTKDVKTSPPCIVAPVSALFQPTLSPVDLQKGHLAVGAGSEFSPETLAAHLVDAGFENAQQVDGPGQFARRGGIMDIFPLFDEKPIRLEFFGDEIDTLRYFDIETQMSGPAITHKVVLVDVTRDSFRHAYTQREKNGLLRYLPDNTVLVLVHPEKIAYVADLYPSGFDEKRCPLLPWEDIQHAAERFTFLTIPELDGEDWPDEVWREARNLSDVTLKTKTLERLSGGMDAALSELRTLLGGGKRVSVFCNNPAERQRLHELLLEQGGNLAGQVELLLGHLSKGFVAADPAWAAIGDQELFGRYQLRRTPRKRYRGSPINDFTQLKQGDYVVHVANGIAKYEGIETLESNGTEQDYLCLRFAEDARIYVPLSHIDLVQRYVGGSEARPKLSRLGTKSWARKRKAAEKAVRDIAADLLRMQAVRRASPGISFPSDDPLQIEFENAFPYEETPDQLAAVADIKTDQERASPMDRLLCGDVGFGKTEVAMRAAFKVALQGMQVAILVPTTILAEQHYRTFRERMADYPVMVNCLSRFRTGSDARRIVEDLQDGRLDIIIGTHRLLSKDVQFKNLGLIIIDEEQRFGVEHKENLKKLRTEVDVLTMTATPIPRTLHMSLLGLRDISNLATAPAERQAISTNVVRYSEPLVRRGILRELSRGGQCYFLHNRVQNIDAMAAELTRLVPEARFGIAHGQMAERELFEVISRFLEKKIDVLVTTTIIESGVDIPSVNTLFVNNADHFGLSALHQLRGRVGRYRHQAYAYFLVPPKRPITPIAEKRLRALEEYSELGAGFRIAMRDLEIRGAGNLLGAEQSGHIHMVGYDLYCRLLEKAVAEMQGTPLEEREPVELNLGSRAFVPTDYISSDTQRVDLYRRLAAAATRDDLSTLRQYLHDRYGPVPPSVESLFDDQALRIRAANAGLSYLGGMDGALVVGFAEGKGRDGIMKLRTLPRKVTPLDRMRWRVELLRSERTAVQILAVVEDILARLSMSMDELRALPQSKESKKPKRQTRTGQRTDDALRSYEASMGSMGSIASVPDETPPKEEKETGTRVLGIEPNESLGIVGAVVNEDDFDTRHFGAVTLVMEKERFFLRYTGTGKSAKGQVSLTLRASSPEEVRAIANAHLAGSSTRLLEGIVE